jgi:hypothetical protein
VAPLVWPYLLSPYRLRDDIDFVLYPFEPTNSSEKKFIPKRMKFFFGKPFSGLLDTIGTHSLSKKKKRPPYYPLLIYPIFKTVRASVYKRAT